MTGEVIDVATAPITMTHQDLTLVNVQAEEEGATIEPFENLERVVVDEQVNLETMAWPWLHESLYLREDLNLDWYDLPQNGPAVNIAHPAFQESQHQSGGVASQSRITEPNQGNLSLGALDSERQAVTIDLLVTTACDYAQRHEALDQSSDIFYKRLPEMIESIKTAFEIKSPSLTDFQYYIDLYRLNFWPLWPLSPRQHFINYSFEPVLYIAMISIGAMYEDKESSAFGIALHNRLREELVRPVLEMDLPERFILPLGQARSLTQAAALYFGHQRAFSYASHLGGALVIQARTMNLFTPKKHALNFMEEGTTHWVRAWINRECRTRLALAILRLEMYTSALFMTRPLVSGHEMDIALPCSKYVWTTSFNSIEAFAAAIRDVSALA